MTLVCRRVARTGRRVVNWGYPSWRRSIDLNGQDLLQTVYDLAEDESVQRIHFLTYSMGSIICRAALLEGSTSAESWQGCDAGTPESRFPRGVAVGTVVWVDGSSCTRTLDQARQLCERLATDARD